MVVGLHRQMIFPWRDNFLSTGIEVAQLHTLVDWMRDEDLD